MGDNVKDLHEELIVSCKKQNPDAQKALYRAYSVAMYNICLRMLANKQDAEDALQDAFIKVFRSINTYQGKSTPGAWIKRIVINKCVDQLKKRPHVDWSDETYNETSERTEQVGESIDSDTINAAIRELPDGCRMVFNLKILEGYDHQEIAEILNISVNTSKSQLHRAKQLLRCSLLKTIEA